MALQDSVLKPSVCRSLSVNTTEEEAHVNARSKAWTDAHKCVCVCGGAFSLMWLGYTEPTELTFGHHSVEDGPELLHRDLHVLRETIFTFDKLTVVDESSTPSPST